MAGRGRSEVQRTADEPITPEGLGIGRLFGEIRDAVVVAELTSGRIILWNPAAEAMFGYPTEEATAMALEDLVPVELQDRHRAGVARYVRTRAGELVDGHEAVPLPAVRKDGARIDIELTFAPITDAPAEGVYMAAVIRDVSERVRLEQDQAALAKNFRLLLDSTGEGLFGIDLEGVCTFMNVSAGDMLGFRPDKVVGRNMHELIHHSHADGRRYPVEDCPIQRSMRIGRGCKVDDEVLWRSDGTSFPAQYSASPIIDEGKVTGAVVSISDITQRKRLEEALRKTNVRLQIAYDTERDAVEKLKTLDSLKNEFVAMVAHDLRSPMTVIAGLADTIRTKWDRLDEARKKEFLGLISQNVNSLSDLIEDVLQVARIESDEFSYEIGPFELGAVAVRTAEEMSRAHARPATKVRVAETLPMALGDEQRNWQILTNLLSNAMKYSPDGAPVEVEVVSDNDMVRVSVRDHGMGIRPEEMGKLFQKFSRVTQTGPVKARGTGLGLYICKRMVEDQGGRIWAESALGEGSTFSYTLPVAGEGEVV
ncbi:MAG: PAS domain S-box protein [Actinomycetota bacterium]